METGQSGKILGGVLFLVGQPVVDDAFQPQQMVLRGHHLDVEPSGTQDPEKFLRQGQGKQAGEQPHGFVPYRQMGRRGAEPVGSLVPGRRRPDRLLGDVHPRQGQTQSLGETGAVVPFSAAYVQKLSGGPVFPGRLNEGLQNGGIGAGVQKGPPGQDLLPGVPRILGVLLLDRQQIHIPLPGNVKAVPIGADKRIDFLIKRLPANGAGVFHMISFFLGDESHPPAAQSAPFGVLMCRGDILVDRYSGRVQTGFCVVRYRAG